MGLVMVMVLMTDGLDELMVDASFGAYIGVVLFPIS